MLIAAYTVKDDFISDPVVACLVLASVFLCVIFVNWRSRLSSVADHVEDRGSYFLAKRGETEMTIRLEDVASVSEREIYLGAI